MCGCTRARVRVQRARHNTLRLFIVSRASANCGSLRRNLSTGVVPHDADGSARMMITHFHLAKVQNRQAVAPFVGELIGRQRHLVLSLMAPELPRGLDTHGRPEVRLRVDHASSLLYVLLLVC